MTHPFRACAVLAAAPALLAQTGFQERLSAVEAVLDQQFRGETLEAAQTRVNALVDAFNALLDLYNTEVKEQNRAAANGEALEPRILGPNPRLEAALKVYAGTLGAGDPGDRLKAGQALADQYEDLKAAVRMARPEARNLRLVRLDADLDEDRKGLEAEQRELKARRASFEAFCAQDGDLAFFRGVNRLLADIRTACRRGPDPESRAALERVRAYRLELARWAAQRQAAQPNGLVLVAALVGDEPCCFIVDTGAQVVSLPQELIEALGLAGTLGEEITHTLAGGQKARGRSLTIPRVAAAGMAAPEVAGSVLPASEVGIDGLLGQSFLKRFVYTIDESRPGKLVLAGR